MLLKTAPAAPPVAPLPGDATSIAEAAVEALRIISGGVDLLQGLLVLADLDPMAAGADAPGALRGVLHEVERVERRLAAGRLRVMRLADRVDVARDEGYADTGAWLAAATKAGRRAAAVQADVAARLAAGASEVAGVLEESLTQQALDAGHISLPHARVIVHALAELPDHLEPVDVWAVEKHLVEQARLVDPVRLRRLARRAIEAVQPDPDIVDADENAVLEDEEQRAARLASFWIRDNQDGTMSGAFCVPRSAGEALRAVLDAMTAPRRQGTSGRSAGESGTPARGGTADSAAGAGSSGGAPSSAAGGAAGTSAEDHGCGGSAAAMSDTAGSDTAGSDTAGSDTAGEGSWKLSQLDWQHRRGSAFADLLALLPTDHLHGRAAASLIVHTDLETLRGEVNRVARTNYGDDMSAGAVRRLACQADVVPAVLGKGSVPLDLGYSARLFSSGQRLALSVLYDSCAADGCDRPYAWCELHHLVPWQDGGRTDLVNAVPLCGHHHRALHDSRTRHTLHRDPGGACSLTFSRIRR